MLLCRTRLTRHNTCSFKKLKIRGENGQGILATFLQKHKSAYSVEVSVFSLVVFGKDQSVL